MTQERFDTLVAALLDGTLSDAERQELDDHVESNPERARALTELLRLEPLLQDSFALDSSGGFPRRIVDALNIGDAGNTQRFTTAVIEKLNESSTSSAPSRQTKGRRWHHWALGAVSLAAMVALVVIFGFRQPEAHVADVRAKDGRVFLIDYGTEVAISGLQAVRRGQGVRCESGTAEIIFPDGSQVVLRAGGSIVSVSDSLENARGPSLVLSSGEIHASVKPQLIGSAFRVKTSSAIIRVVGTQFTVSEEGSKTRLDVQEGKVELQRTEDGAKVDVSTGQFAVVAPNAEFAPAPVGTPKLSAISYLGSDGSDAVVGAAIQNDGTVLLAANLEGDWNGRTPIDLSGKGPSAKGTIIRLTSSGQSVLSIARVATRISDMSIDAAGAIYIAADLEGLLKLDAGASRIVWRADTEQPCLRVDAGLDGTAAVLIKNSKEPGRVSIFSMDGKVINTREAPFYANDVALDSEHRLLFIGGARTGQIARGEIGSVACLNAYDWEGNEAWRNYGYHPAMQTDLKSHTSCERIAMGADGKLYGSFLSIGGSNIFSRDPKSITTEVAMTGTDAYNRAYSTGHTYITFVARYEPKSGDLLAGQLLLGRDSSGKGSDISPVGGDLGADSEGRVYLVGKANSGGPVSRNAKSLNEYSGQEAFLCIFAPNLRSRESYSTFNLSDRGGSSAQCIAVPRRAALKGAYAMAGTVSANAGGVRTLNAIQDARAKNTEGFFVISGFPERE